MNAMLKALDAVYEALDKPSWIEYPPKPRSSDEMPETPEERADRKHREAGQDRELPCVPFDDPHDIAKYYEEPEPVPESIEEEQYGPF